MNQMFVVNFKQKIIDPMKITVLEIKILMEKMETI